MMKSRDLSESIKSLNIVKLTEVIAVRKDLIIAVGAFVGTIILAEG